MYQEKFEELKHTGKLPSPSGVGMRILLLTQNEECSLDEIVQTIQADPALTGRVIKLATSALLTGAAPLGSVREAAVRVGLRGVCNLALGFSLISGNRNGKCEGFDYDGYWSYSLANAVAAQLIARRFGIGSPAEAFTCALLSEIGRLALASVHPTEYSEVLRKLKDNPRLDLTRLEKEHFCIDHREVAAALLEDWGLPPSFSEAILLLDGREPSVPLEHQQTADLLRIMNASSVMAEVCVSDLDRQHHLWPELKSICADLQTDSAEMCLVFDRVSSEWKEWGHLLDVPTRQVLSALDLERRSESLISVEKARTQAGDRRALRILAVDDDLVSLKLLVTVLEKDGNEVITATNGREALALALEKNPQMVITDWMMPEMDGLELCKHLRRMEEGRKLYILILTGRTEEERIVEAFDAGADDYIVKPFKPRLLLARIKPGKRVISEQEETNRQMREKEERNAQLQKAERQLNIAVMTDPLTNLPNRRYAMQRLERDWSNSERIGRPLSVIMLDIDDFKSVNDRFGHDIGDVVLQSTAEAIREGLRRSDTCARIGGEEFLVICPNTPADAAMRMAERIRLQVETNFIQSDGFHGSVTASLGVGTRSTEIPSIDALLKMADEAVYEAKRAGRNRVVVGRPQRDRRSA